MHNDPYFSDPSPKHKAPRESFPVPWTAILVTIAACAGWWLSALLLRNHYR